MKKYEFTGDTMHFEGRTLHRIRYLMNLDYPFPLKNLLGGWIENEANLPHEGESVVFGEAKVFGNAKVIGHAHVEDNAIVKDNAIIGGFSRVYDNAIVGADTTVDDLTWIRGASKVFFYHNPKNILIDYEKPRPNIWGDSLVDGTTVIEATGSIADSEILNSQVYGDVKLKHMSLDNFTINL